MEALQLLNTDTSTMAQPMRKFETDLLFETTKSEEKRVRILLGVLGLILFGGLGSYTFARQIMLTVFASADSYLYLLISVVLFAAYEGLYFILIRRFIQQGKSIPRPLYFGNIVVESFLPTAGLLILSILEERAAFLDSPVVLIYFLFIILSALRLDFKLSVFSGLIAAIQYTFLSIYLLEFVHPMSNHPISLPPFTYYIRGPILLGAGVMTGFVASEIKRKVFLSYQQEQEKQKIFNLLGQHVSNEVAEKLIGTNTHLVPTKAVASILFLDIRNFSNFAEDKTPEEIIAFQNNVFNPLIEIVNSQNGVIHQFFGDGFLATFGIPVPDENHGQKALDASLLMLEKVRTLGESGTIPKIRIGIGLHRGEIVAGNIGNEIKSQYSVSGRNVILAARLEQLNKQFGSQFLVTQAFLSGLSEAAPETESVGKVNVKGFEEAIEVFKVE